MRPILEEFGDYLQRERGLASCTTQYYVEFADRFLSCRFRRVPAKFRMIRAEDITTFVLKHARDQSPGRAKLMVTSLRALFRFLRLRGQISRDLAACVPSVADWRLSELPKSLPAEQVEQVLVRCDRRRPAGRRDFAVLMVLARLGLRASEILNLELGDLHWETGEITTRGKGGSLHRLPMPREVGRALVTYLRNARPKQSLDRHVFLRAYPPFQGLGHPSTVSTLVQRAIHRAGLHPPRTGAHVFRHSLACRMLMRGATLAEIGEVLRHRRPDTTAIYAKVDLNRLRPLAQPWPGAGR